MIITGHFFVSMSCGGPDFRGFPEFLGAAETGLGKVTHVLALLWCICFNFFQEMRLVTLFTRG